jgi:hypothetical protein
VSWLVVVGMETILLRHLLVGIMMLCLTRKNLYVDMLRGGGGGHVDFGNWRRCKGLARQNAMTRACQSLENTVMQISVNHRYRIINRIIL